jgi:thymidylate synthase (FAD)
MSQITVLAHTVVTLDYYAVSRRLGFDQHPQVPGQTLETLPEFAGRNCYRSWHRPNPATATTEGYIQHILEVEHHSVLEHSSVTFFIENVSRALLAELTRHRHFSFSVLSQRYHRLDGDTDPVVHPEFEDDKFALRELELAWRSAVESYQGLLEYFTEKLEQDGVTGTTAKKRAAQAARMVLPNATPTDIVITGNLRAWLDFMPKRDSDAADLEIAAEAREIKRLLAELAPTVFS